MKTLWTQLFSSRTRSACKAARPSRRAHLNIEKLDDRVLPSATSALGNGILTITADNNGSNVSFLPTGSQWAVAQGGSSQTFNGPINEVIFKGGTGNDTFSNQSSVNCLVIGSPGGVRAINVFGSTVTLLANDVYNGGTGVNLLDRNGNDVSWNSTTGQNVTFGLSNASATASELSATGAMMASLSADHTQLTIAGPSGIGFRLDVVGGGQWQDAPSTTNGQTKHSFTPSLTSGGLVKLHSGNIFLGDLPIVGAGLAQLTITTKTAPWTDPVGEFDKLTAGPGGILPLDTTALSQTPFVNFGEQYGLDLQMPSTSWGLQLGSTLTASGGALTGAPLNNAVPYFYVAINRTLSANLGEIELKVGQPNIQVAFDPSDPFIYGSIGAYAVGASINGRIPYTPDVAFTGPVFGASVPNPDISGNVYLKGKIKLEELPLTIKGNATIGLVKDVNGKIPTFNRTTGNALLQGQQSLMALAKSLSVKPRIGVNAELDVGVEVGQGAFELGVAVGKASAFFIPDYVNPNPRPEQRRHRHVEGSE